LAKRCTAVGYEWAVESENPTLCQALYEVGAVNAATDPDAAWQAWSECIEVGRQGAINGGSRGAALFQSALLPALRGDFSLAFALLGEAVRTLRPRGRTPELDGVFGYAIEIFARANELDRAALVIGAVTSGVIQSLRDMPLPPERKPVDVRLIRDELGREQFAECAARGASMHYDELTTWLLETCDDLAGDVS